MFPLFSLNVRPFPSASVAFNRITRVPMATSSRTLDTCDDVTKTGTLSLTLTTVMLTCADAEDEGDPPSVAVTLSM